MLLGVGCNPVSQASIVFPDIRSGRLCMLVFIIENQFVIIPVENFLKKISQIICRSQEKPYLCIAFEKKV